MTTGIIDVELDLLQRRADEIVTRYELVLSESRGQGWIGYSKELPGVVVHAATPDECSRAARTAQRDSVVALLRNNLPVPEPGGEPRVLQMNLRITPSDRAAFQRAAEKTGSRSVSEFVREAALEAARKLI